MVNYLWQILLRKHSPAPDLLPLLQPVNFFQTELYTVFLITWAFVVKAGKRNKTVKDECSNFIIKVSFDEYILFVIER